jgi:hypothetical protein
MIIDIVLGIDFKADREIRANPTAPNIPRARYIDRR